MLRFPAHPRQARLLIEAEARGVEREGAIVAALLGARELRLEKRGPRGVARIAADSDLIEDLDALLAARADRMRPAALRDLGLDVATAQAGSIAPSRASSSSAAAAATGGGGSNHGTSVRRAKPAACSSSAASARSARMISGASRARRVSKSWRV